MGASDWDKELAKIDKQLESVSDRELAPPAPAPGRPARAEPTRAKTASTLGVFALILVAFALAVALVFWPYPKRCGNDLVVYLIAVAVVAVAGWWSAFWTWRHRVAKAHVLALLLILWGLVLGAVEVLPRVGYARPDIDHPTMWMCE